MFVDIFSFWDHPVITYKPLFFYSLFFLGFVGFLIMLNYLDYWYSPTSASTGVSVILNQVKKFVGVGGLVSVFGLEWCLSAFLLTAGVSVVSLFSPWCYPFYVHTIFVLGASFSFWLLSLVLSFFIGDMSFLSLFCLPLDYLGLSVVLIELEFLGKFLQWITVSLRLSLNMIVGGFLIQGAFSSFGLVESVLSSVFWKNFCFSSVLGLVFLFSFCLLVLMYELVAMGLQIFLFSFLWRLYLSPKEKKGFTALTRDSWPSWHANLLWRWRQPGWFGTWLAEVIYQFTIRTKIGHYLGEKFKKWVRDSL